MNTIVIINIVLNYIGGMLRFILGTIFRKIYNMKTYSFKECLNGPPEKEINYMFQNNQHRHDNEFIGMIFLMFFWFLLIIVT